MPEPYISARNLSKVYQSGTSDLVVFANLDLDVYRGEMLALVGESGRRQVHFVASPGRSGQSFQRYDILRKERNFRTRSTRNRRIFVIGK